MADNIQVNYEGLKSISNKFASNLEDIKQVRQQIQQQVDVLNSGKFIGVGADRFYNEMNSILFPALDRLQQALDTASQRIDEISKTFESAEVEAESSVQLSE